MDIQNPYLLFILSSFLHWAELRAHNILTKMKLRKFTILPLITALLVSLTACQSTSEENGEPSAVSATSSEENTALPGQGVTVRSGHSDWLEELFTTEVVNIGLEELGYEHADLQQAAYPALHLAIANGDLDYHTSYYDPFQLDMFENSGGEEKLTPVGQLSPGQGGYLIDKATAENYQITNIEQLQDPELAQLFDTDGDGKANLVGCQPGWGCNEEAFHHIDVYGLQDTVEQDEANYTVLLADMITRYEQGNPILFYAYNPHWVFVSLELNNDVVWLEVPFTDLPGDQSGLKDEDTTINGKNLGRPPALQRILANPDFLAAHPSAQRWFELVEIPASAVSAVSLRIEEGENTPDDIRRHAEEWVVQNRDQVDQWLEDARQAAN